MRKIGAMRLAPAGAAVRQGGPEVPLIQPLFAGVGRLFAQIAQGNRARQDFGRLLP
jgi:hypothetical protein